MAFTTIPAAGAKLRASVLSSLITEVRPVPAYKTADKTVNNSAALQNDDALFVAVVANAVYELEGRLLYNGNSTADLKLGWTFPTGLTMSYSILGVFTATPTVFSTSDFIQTSNPALEGAGANRSAELWGLVTVSSTAGTLQLQWAQQTANASDTKMVAGSYVKLTQVA